VNISSFILTTLILFYCLVQNNITDPAFEAEPAPRESGFSMEGYWVWGGSMIKEGSEYHLFASRWKKDEPFPSGYMNKSEIVRATSPTPFGPFRFEEIVIGERDSIYWDSNMAHNPTIHKIGSEFVLFYIGRDFTTYGDSKRPLRRVGYATAPSPSGPWKRCDKPLIETESNNPAIMIEDSRVVMVFRDAALRVYIAESESHTGPFIIKNDNVWPDCKIEDFYIYKADNRYHIICEDNVGGISGNVRWGVHLVSENGIAGWKKYEPVVVYNHDIVFSDGYILKCNRRERPQLLTENGEITHILTGVFDGSNSWCQPVKLKNPVKIDN